MLLDCAELEPIQIVVDIGREICVEVTDEFVELGVVCCRPVVLDVVRDLFAAEEQKVGDFCLVVLSLLGDEERDEPFPPHRPAAPSIVVLAHVERVEKCAHACGDELLMLLLK